MQTISYGIKFYLLGFSKTQKDCKSREVDYAIYQQNPNFCVVDCLLEYCECTKSFRDSDKSNDPLLRTIIKPRKGVTAKSVSTG